MKKTIPFLIAVLVLVSIATAVSASSEYPWRDHAAPYDFTFGNHIDTHQQSKQVGGNKLAGFLYIRYTGDFTDAGVPVAEHGNCAATDDCTVGWTLQGITTSAEYCGHSTGQHPTWAVDPANLPQQSVFTHFHWLGPPDHAGMGLVEGESYNGYVLKLTAQDRFFFRHHGGFDITRGIDYQSHANIVPQCG